MALTQKDGASNSARPAVCPSGLSTGRTGTGQDLKGQIRQLYDVLGPSILRLDDGRACVLSAQALQIVEIPLSHEALNA